MKAGSGKLSNISPRSGVFIKGKFMKALDIKRGDYFLPVSGNIAYRATSDAVPFLSGEAQIQISSSTTVISGNVYKLTKSEYEKAKE